MKVLLVIARGLRPDLVGAYGNGWVQTPALDALAAGAVVFDRHFADRTDPAGADRSWRTGRYQPDAPRPDGPDLLLALRAAGVRTRLILDASHPEPEVLAAGWDRVQRALAGADESSLEAACAAAERALRALPEDGWLLGLSLATALPPWDVPEEFLDPIFGGSSGEEDEEEAEEPDESLEPLADVPAGPIDPEDDSLSLRLRASAAAAVGYLDAGIGQVLEALGTREDVVVVVTANAGLPLGEHGLAGPAQPGAHHEWAHLPLLLRLPGLPEGRRVAALTQPVDLAPTLAELFGVALPGVHGGSLLPLARGAVEILRPCAVSFAPLPGGVAAALRTPDWTYLAPRPDGAAGRLHVRPDDPCEVNDVLPRDPARGEALQGVLQAFVQAARADGPLAYPPVN
jgi:arylsulfatase A-like enzyme